MKVKKTSNGISFKCPGCKDTHTIPIEGPKAWSWNGSFDKPTIHPSLNVTTGHYTKHWKKGDSCWCGKNYNFSCYRCHSIISEGKIFFCPDSTHILSGRTVDLEDIRD